MCSLHLTNPSGAVGSRHCGAVGGSVPCSSGLTSVVDTFCQSQDSKPQPWVTSPTLYPLGHDCPTNGNTRNGVRLGSRHQGPPHTDVSRNLATVVVRGVLPGLRRRRTGLLPSGPKVLFSDESKFCI